MLVRHRAGPHTYHLLPGGGVEGGETLQDALLREMREETGLDVRLVRPLLLSDTIDTGRGRHIVNITFLTEVVGGHITRKPLDGRVEAVEIVPPDALAALDLRPPIALVLAEAYANGFSGEARYLGSLWVDGPS